MTIRASLIGMALGLCAFAAQAQAPQYGTEINVEQAKKAIAAG